MALSEEDAARVAAHWSRKAGTSPNWWTNGVAMRDHNRRISGVPDRSSIGGLLRLIAGAADRPLRSAISVGCGFGAKEIAMAQAGTVETMVGYDTSPARIAWAQAAAAEAGLAARVSFRCADAFDDAGPHDLVVWSGALHHMPDVRQAIAWSRDVLTEGGIFAMSEYVEPTRFQLDPESLRRVNRLRADLPKRLFVGANGRAMPVELTLEILESACVKDPSEACDSGRILPALREFFPDADIREADGLFFFIGLGGLYAGLDMANEDDHALLQAILLIDEICDSPPLLAAAVARKD